MESDLVWEESLSYEGLFDVKGLFSVIQDWSHDKGYWLQETSQTESAKEEGKFIELNLEPNKKITDYVRLRVKIRVQMSKVKDVSITRDGKKTKLQEGEVKMAFQAIVETDYEGRWESKPIWYVLRTMMHKYVLHPYVGKYEKDVKADLAVLRNNLGSYLNLSKFTA